MSPARDTERNVAAGRDISRVGPPGFRLLDPRYVMPPRRLRLSTAGLAAAVISCAALIGAGTATAAPTVSVVAKGLNAPRHLTFGPGGDLYVAVAGVGGRDRRGCLLGTGVRGTATRFCPGQSSAVDRVTLSGHSSPLLKLLPSIRETDTGQVTRAEAVTFHTGHLASTENRKTDEVGGETLGEARDTGFPDEVERVLLPGQQSVNATVRGLRASSSPRRAVCRCSYLSCRTTGSSGRRRAVKRCWAVDGTGLTYVAPLILTYRPVAGILESSASTPV